MKITGPEIKAPANQFGNAALFGIVPGVNTGDAAPARNTGLDETGVFQNEIISETMGETHQKLF